MMLVETLKNKERLRNDYWEKRDHFLDLRLKWRAQMARHLFHLLPGESILEIGCANGQWTRVLSANNRDSNPICAVTFSPEFHANLKSQNLPKNIEIQYLESFPGELKGRQFDTIVAWHVLPNENYGQFLSIAKTLLKPGGHFLLFEPNPWNPYYRFRHLMSKLFFLKSRKQTQASFDRFQMFSILSEIGFTGIRILPYDFLFPPIPKFLTWPMENLSLIFENTPFVRNFAGDLFLYGQKPPPENWERPLVSLARHPKLYGKVSIVVPCHNEEPNIPSLVKNLKAFYNDYIHEIILVDDNSRDRTAEIGERLAQQDPRIKVVRRSMPNGVGRALRDGIAAATGDYLLLMDCDFQHILPEISGLFEAVADGADMALGSRFSRESILLNYAFTKILANRGFHLLARILFKKSFRDVTNNLKLMTRQVADQLRLESDDFAANAETGLQPILLGFDVREVPISWINRSVDMGFSSFNLAKTGPNYLAVFWRLFSRQLRGKQIVLPLKAKAPK